jgi:hypothetical protein
MRRCGIAIVAWLAGLVLACGSGGGEADVTEVAGGDADVAEVPLDCICEGPAEEVVAPKPLKELIGPAITHTVRLVLDQGLKGRYDEAKLKAYVLGRELREADDFGTLTNTEDWWDDYQDEAEILYYSSEHVFSDESPYKGRTFMPGVWPDMKYKVRDVTIEYADLAAFYAAGEARKKTVAEPEGTEWTLLSANDAFAWVEEQFPHAPDEMVVVVADNPNYDGKAWSYYFVEEKYGKDRGFKTYPFNTPFDQWPAAMQQAEGLTPHDLPIWMHFAFVNGEWDAGAKKWRLFPNGRWGGYDGTSVYVIEASRDLALDGQSCDPKPSRPDTHFWLDETAYKRCLDDTERLEYDWHRLWRHAYMVPAIPFWGTEKIDVRVVLLDLRKWTGGKPEYEVDDVLDWQTFQDSVRAANPFANIAFQQYLVTPPSDVRDVIVKHLVEKADFPLHSDVRLLKTDGTWKTLHLDWHHHVDISGLPGMQVYFADKLREYWGGADVVDEVVVPRDYDPFARPYRETGKPFVTPALFFLTPRAEFSGTVGGWTTNTGQLMCVFARQFGMTCEQIMQMMTDAFGGPVGPNLNAWSDAYGLWWEIFFMDWTYTTAPMKTLRFLLDPAPFHALIQSVPQYGELLDQAAPLLYPQVFGWFHPWATGFPFWLKEGPEDADARELSREFASFQFAETLQHNIGYKHQTTVIPDAPYLGMEKGFDYRKHHDLAETFEMTVEEATIPFYSTEPGSRDFPIDANSYMTFKMGAGTQHMLKRVFARREVLALWDAIVAADATFQSADADFRAAVDHYLKAADAAIGWRHEDAWHEALAGLESMDAFFTAKGEPDRLHTDWDHAPAPFTPAATGLPGDATQIDKDLHFFSGL